MGTFREMRRIRQQLTSEQCIDILDRNTAGTLAVLGDEGYPYAVPLSYVYADGSIYFHSAKSGHKIDAVRTCGKASFSVIDKDEIIPEKFTTAFRSVIAFGHIRILEDDAEIRRAIEKLADKYSPNAAGKQEEIQSGWNRMYLLELKIDHMTGKQGIELCQK